MKTHPSLAELVVREITGEGLSAAETDQVQAWTAGNPAHARMLARLRDAQWRMQEWQRYKDVDKEAVWTQMQIRAAAMPGQPPLPGLENPDWGGGVGGAQKNRTIKGWVLAALLAVAAIFY